MRCAHVIAAAALCAGAASAQAKPETDVQTYEVHSGRGALGISVLGLTDPLKVFFGSGKDGVLVGAVLPSSPAEKAGVHVGDVLFKVEGKPVDDVADVRAALAGKHKGDHTKLEAIRDHRVVALDATLDADPPAVSFEGPLELGPGMPHLLRGPGDMDLDRWMEHVESELRELRGAHGGGSQPAPHDRS